MHLLEKGQKKEVTITMTSFLNCNLFLTKQNMLDDMRKALTLPQLLREQILFLD